LCDEQYKNIKDIGDILTVLEKGANAGAMPAWKNRLSTNQMVMVASYVASLRGTNPAVAKDGEGRAIGPWPEAPAQEEAAADDAESSENAGKADDSGQSGTSAEQE
jgi:cytochrome c oxidase cbb3-type subunit 3